MGFFLRARIARHRQMSVFIALEIAQPDDDGIGVVRSGDLGDPAGQRVDEVRVLCGVSAGQDRQSRAAS